MTTIRKARKEDLPVVLQLLDESSLPKAGVEQHFENFFVAEDGGDVIGAIGVEIYGDVGLLRSAVVRKELQRQGIGKQLYQTLVTVAKSIGIKRLILLTTTAADYFAQKGFRVIDKAMVQGPVTSSAEFTGACPKSATCMELML
ncbi:MAG: arsenic resistance N-acetyltransferase ArsN2 [Bacteroidota bacterium]